MLGRALPKGERALGRGGQRLSAALRLPPIGLGRAALGVEAGGAGDGDALAPLRTAHSAGIADLDTPPLYGDGRSERRIGRALAGSGGERPLLSTKVGYRVNSPPGLEAGRRRAG